MKPQPSQHVKCFLRNSTVVEGVVEEWSDTSIVLKSLDDKSFLILHNPAADIVLTKVLTVPEGTRREPEVKQAIRTKLQEAQVIEDPELQNKSIQELRQMVVEQEKMIIANKIKEHHLGDVRQVKYQYPSFMTKK